jgi:hypothetical protein
LLDNVVERFAVFVAIAIIPVSFLAIIVVILAIAIVPEFVGIVASVFARFAILLVFFCRYCVANRPSPILMDGWIMDVRRESEALRKRGLELDCYSRE